MASLSALRSEKNQYINLKNAIQSVSTQLGKAVDCLDTASKIKDNYLIDEISGDNNKIANNKIEISKCKASLDNEICSEIDAQIRRLDREIAAEIRRIEEERRRREAAARAAQAKKTARNLAK